MREHTRKPHTEKYVEVSHREEKPMSVNEFIQECFGDLPRWAVALQGLRAREGLTQASLGKMLGIEQTNISKMERGKRLIGKNVAKKLADLFKTDYRIFL